MEDNHSAMKLFTTGFKKKESLFSRKQGKLQKPLPLCILEASSPSDCPGFNSQSWRMTPVVLLEHSHPS